MSPCIEAGAIGIEVEELSARIIVARAEWKRQQDEEYPTISEPPQGLYDQKQLNRFLKADNAIVSAVSRVLTDLGIQNFQLEKDFGFAKRNRGNKGVSYKLKFRDGEKEEELTDNQGYKQISFHYDPGGRVTHESLYLHITELVVPKKKLYTGSLTLHEAQALLKSPDATEYTQTNVGIFDITEENVSGLLVIGLAAPIEVRPKSS